MRADRAIAVLGAAVLLAGCRSVFAPSPLPAGWRALAGDPPPFAALYRLDCCGRRDLLGTVRFDGPHLDLTVTSQPGAAVLRAWLEHDGGWLLEQGAGCAERLSGGELPLGEKIRLPLDPSLTAMVLSGRVPVDGEPLAGRAGWIAGRLRGRMWRAEIEDGPVRCTRLELDDAGSGRDKLAATLGSYRQVGVPGTVELHVGGQIVTLTLVEMRGTAPLAPPAWLSGPHCAATR